MILVIGLSLDIGEFFKLSTGHYSMKNYRDYLRFWMIFSFFVEDNIHVANHLNPIWTFSFCESWPVLSAFTLTVLPFRAPNWKLGCFSGPLTLAGHECQFCHMRLLKTIYSPKELSDASRRKQSCILISLFVFTSFRNLVSKCLCCIGLVYSFK